MCIRCSTGKVSAISGAAARRAAQQPPILVLAEQKWLEEAGGASANKNTDIWEPAWGRRGAKSIQRLLSVSAQHSSFSRQSQK